MLQVHCHVDDRHHLMARYNDIQYASPGVSQDRKAVAAQVSPAIHPSPTPSQHPPTHTGTNRAAIASIYNFSVDKLRTSLLHLSIHTTPFFVFFVLLVFFLNSMAAIPPIQLLLIFLGTNNTTTTSDNTREKKKEGNRDASRPRSRVLCWVGVAGIGRKASE